MQYTLIPEVDRAILRRLPDEGARLGVRPIGKQVRALSQDLVDVGLTSAEIAGRLKTLMALGYVVKVAVQPVSHGKGYQATPTGRAYAEEGGE